MVLYVDELARSLAREVRTRLLLATEPHSPPATIDPTFQAFYGVSPSPTDLLLTWPLAVAAAGAEAGEVRPGRLTYALKSIVNHQPEALQRALAAHTRDVGGDLVEGMERLSQDPAFAEVTVGKPTRLSIQTVENFRHPTVRWALQVHLLGDPALLAEAKPRSIPGAAPAGTQAAYLVDKPAVSFGGEPHTQARRHTGLGRPRPPGTAR